MISKLFVLTAVSVLLASSIAAAAPRLQTQAGDDETQPIFNVYSPDPDQRYDHLGQ